MIKLKDLVEQKKYSVKVKPKTKKNAHKWYYKKGQDQTGKTLTVYDNPHFPDKFDTNRHGGSYHLSKDDVKVIKNESKLFVEKKDFENVSWPKDMGKKPECSLGKDKDGYFVYTHRARSSSYKTPQQIPKDKIKFIESTG